MTTTTLKPRRTVRQPHGIARLMILISGATYTLRRIPCDPSIAARAWRLRKPDGAAYYVALTEYGPTCDCPDWTFHREGRDAEGCKHIRALKAVGLIEGHTGRIER